MKKIKVSYVDGFHASFKKLMKKYPSLQQDFDIFLKALKIKPKGYPPNIVRVSGLWENVSLPIYKVKKFALSCQKTHNEIRIIYAYDSEHEHIEFIEFIEIYHKNQKANHDIKKIQELYGGVSYLS